MKRELPINEAINIKKYGSRSNDKRNVAILKAYIDDADIYKLAGTKKRTKKQAFIDESLFLFTDLPLAPNEGKQFVDDIKNQRKYYLLVTDGHAYIAILTKEQIIINEFREAHDLGGTFEFGGYTFTNSGKKF